MLISLNILKISAEGFYIFIQKYFQTNLMLGASLPLIVYTLGLVWFYTFTFKQKSIETNLQSGAPVPSAVYTRHTTHTLGYFCK